AITYSQQLSRNGCRRSERLRWRHARFDQPLELARVLAEHRIDGVRSHSNLDTQLHALCDRRKIALDVVLERAFDSGSEAEFILRVDVVAIVIDGWAPHEAPRSHRLHAFV